MTVARFLLGKVYDLPSAGDNAKGAIFMALSGLGAGRRECRRPEGDPMDSRPVEFIMDLDKTAKLVKGAWGQILVWNLPVTRAFEKEFYRTVLCSTNKVVRAH